MIKITLGSLFDGSGGFPLGGLISGITPLWASEIEPFPILVTTKNFPKMKHYGDINKISGAEIEPVDIITFGSPCQDMSVAGKRAGLNGSRSSLFHEAIRVITEMRKATNGKYPRFIVWENVPGVFSSNRGEDFKTVLEEICKIKDEQVHIPKPKKWCGAGKIVGNGYSVAWRQLDAQFWGVPQRRKRIYLVADFADECAEKILFESESLPRNSFPSFKSWQETANGTAESIGETSQIRAKQFDVRISNDRYNVYQTENSRTLTTNGNAPNSNQGGLVLLEPVYGINRRNIGQGFNPNFDFNFTVDVEPTLVASGANAVAHVVYCLSKNSHNTIANKNIASTLVATDYKSPPIINDLDDNNIDYIVRRLTPTECARLQGFPDWWCKDINISEPTDEEIIYWKLVFDNYAKAIGKTIKPKTDNQIKKWLKNPHSDSAEYKMWGNGVALPCVCFVLSRISNIDL